MLPQLSEMPLFLQHIFAFLVIVRLVIIPPLRYQAKVEGKVRLATGKALASAPEKEVFADCHFFHGLCIMYFL